MRGQLCERARQWASLRLDDELSELESALLDAHLGRCADCRAFVVDTQVVAGALRTAVLEQPAALVVPVPRSVRRPVRVLQAGVGAALIVAAAGLGSLLGITDRSGAAPSTALKHTAMIADDNLGLRRELRPSMLVGSKRLIPRNLAIPDDTV